MGGTCMYATFLFEGDVHVDPLVNATATLLPVDAELAERGS